MGEAKRRGTREQRVAEAAAKAEAIAKAQAAARLEREAKFEKAKAQLKAEREAAEALRAKSASGRAVITKGGTDRRMNRALVAAALLAALGPTK